MRMGLDHDFEEQKKRLNELVGLDLILKGKEGRTFHENAIACRFLFEAIDFPLDAEQDAEWVAKAKFLVDKLAVLGQALEQGNNSQAASAKIAVKGAFKDFKTAFESSNRPMEENNWRGIRFSVAATVALGCLIGVLIVGTGGLAGGLLLGGFIVSGIVVMAMKKYDMSFKTPSLVGRRMEQVGDTMAHATQSTVNHSEGLTKRGPAKTETFVSMPLKKGDAPDHGNMEAISAKHLDADTSHHAQGTSKSSPGHH